MGVKHRYQSRYQTLMRHHFQKFPFQLSALVREIGFSKRPKPQRNGFALLKLSHDPSHCTPKIYMTPCPGSDIMSGFQIINDN